MTDRTERGEEGKFSRFNGGMKEDRHFGGAAGNSSLNAKRTLK
jgi:hypothetical protein